jgi:SNF2 family DNA or RNA helicase
VYEYQDQGIEFLRRTGRAILGDDPGLGKSRQALLAAEGRTLIVAPAMILDSGVWQDEVARWRPDLDVRAVAYSSLCQREKTERGGTRVLEVPKPEYLGPWDTVICDEAHYLKGRKTNWTLAAEKLRTDRLYLLTGTAVPNWAHELYMLLKFCHPKDRRFTSYWRWVGEWFHINLVQVDRMGTTTRKIGGLVGCTDECEGLCEHWVAFQEANLGDCFLRRLRDDVLGELPPLTEQHLVTPMQPEQRRVYKALKKDFIATTESGAEIVAWTKAAQVTKLARIATSTELVDPTTHSSGKLDVIRELLDERRQSNTLLLAYFQDTAQALLRLCAELDLPALAILQQTPKAQRREIKDRFQSGGWPVLVTTIELIKEGVTLTRADGVIFTEHSYRPSSNEQALRRIHRIGQERPVTAYHLWTEDSIDEGMRPLLAEKTDQQIKALPIAELLKLI